MIAACCEVSSYMRFERVQTYAVSCIVQRQHSLCPVNSCFHHVNTHATTCREVLRTHICCSSPVTYTVCVCCKCRAIKALPAQLGVTCCRLEGLVVKLLASF